MGPPLNTILIYARNMDTTAAFYQKYFGFELSDSVAAGLITLRSPAGGAHIVIHQAAKGVKLGHVGIKLVFDVEDIEAFKQRSAELGLEFGSTHHGEGYTFANAKDPDMNSIAISSRAFA